MRASLHTLRLVIGAGLVVTLAISVHSLQVRGDHETAALALRDARISLQRAETARAVLASDSGRLASLDMPRESFELALIEAVTTLAGSSGVSELQYKRVVSTPASPYGAAVLDDGVMPLRVALSFRSDHAVAFLETLHALAVLTDERPVQFSGCRLLRAHRSLAASCAVDWLWWDTA